MSRDINLVFQVQTVSGVVTIVLVLVVNCISGVLNISLGLRCFDEQMHFRATTTWLECVLHTWMDQHLLRFGEHKTFGGNTWNVTPRIYANFLQDYVDGIKEILMILRAREYFQERYSLTALTCANQPTSN